MADSNTTLFGLTLPEVGASADTWGTKLNSGLTFLDVLFAQINPVQHRLSLTTAVPVTVSDVTAATTLYMTPDKGNGIVNFDGTYWDVVAQSELSLAFSSNNAHTNYHQSGKNFDVWYFDDGGTKRIGTGAAWTNDTTRADALVRLNGVYVNNATIAAMRFGSASGNTVSVSANRATWLGTIRMSADGQCEDSLAKRFVWNAYNRRPRAMRVLEATDSWTYTSTTVRQTNNSTANQLAFVRGLDEDAAKAWTHAEATTSDTTKHTIATSIGLDSTSAFAAGSFPAFVQIINSTNGPQLGAPTAHYEGFPGLGYHYLAWQEKGGGSGTVTWYGDNGAPSATQNGIFGEVFA